MMCHKCLVVNFSELYGIRAASLLQQMVEKKIVLAEDKKQVEQYSQTYARDAALTSAVINRVTPTLLVKLCNIMKLSTQHANIAMKLMRVSVFVGVCMTNHRV